MFANNTVGVSIAYHTGSTAKGALLNFMLETGNGSIDYEKSVILPVKSNITRGHILPIQLFPGQYRVFFHDIEQSGTLLSGLGYPALSQKLTISTGIKILSRHDTIIIMYAVFHNKINIETDVHPGHGQILVHLSNCSIKTFPLLIRVKCAYSGDSGAMVTGFQVIAQPADFDRSRPGKLYASHTMRCQTSAIVEVEQNGEFLVI